MEEKSGFKWEVVEYILTMLGFAGIQQAISFFKGGKIKAGLAEVASHVANSGVSGSQQQETPYGVLLVQTLVEMNADDNQRQALEKLAECLKRSIANNKDDRIVKILTSFLRSDDVNENAKKLTSLMGMVSDTGSGLSFDEVMELAEKDPLQALARAEEEAKEKIKKAGESLAIGVKKAKEKVLKFFKKKTVLLPVIFLSIIFLIAVILFSAAIIMCLNGSYNTWLIKKLFFQSYLLLFFCMFITGMFLKIILKTLSLATSVFSKLEEDFVDLYYNPEKAEKVVSNFFLLMWWMAVASFICFLVPLYNNTMLLTVVILAILFFIISVLAGVITPDPRIYKRIWSMVFLGFILAVILLIIGPSSYRHSAHSIEKAKTKVAQILDDRLAKKIDALTEALKQAEEDGDEKKIDDLTNQLNQLSAEVDDNRKSPINFDSMKKALLFGSEKKGQQIKQDNQISRPIYKKMLTLNGAWQKLETVPQNGFHYRFDLPDTLTKIQTMYERHPETTKNLTVLGTFSETYMNAPNPGNIPLLVRIVSGEQKEVFLTVIKY